MYIFDSKKTCVTSTYSLVNLINDPNTSGGGDPLSGVHVTIKEKDGFVCR